MIEGGDRVSRTGRALRSGRLAALAMAALLMILPSAAIAAEGCKGPLTGPEFAVPPDILGFGRVQGLPALPLAKNQYVVTIDDGPSPKTTPRLLAILAEHCVKATFFLVGKNAEAHPDLVRQILAEGHTIGTHSYSHADLSKLSQDAIEAEMLNGLRAVQAAAEGAAGGAPSLSLFRFPGSSGMPPVLPAALVAMAHRDGLIVAGIDFSPQDWRNSPPEESFKRLFLNWGDRGVILFHDNMPNTIGLLPLVFAELQRNGNQIVALKP